MDRWCARAAIAVTVLTLHAAALENVFRKEFHNSPRETEETPITEAQIIETGVGRGKVPAPDLQLMTVMADFPGPPHVEFDDSVRDELDAVIGPMSAPHLARVQSVDPAIFARRAKLPVGVALTILLSVEVTEDGSVDSVDVIRTSGNAAADAAAIDYAQELRWVPGTIGRLPKTLRVILPVTLVSPTAAQLLAPSCPYVHG